MNSKINYIGIIISTFLLIEIGALALEESSVDPIDLPGLEQAVDIAMDQVEEVGINQYNFFDYLCVGSAYRLGVHLLDDPCTGGGIPPLNGWRVRTVEIPECHNGTMLTSPHTGKHYFIDIYVYPYMSSIDHLIEMEEFLEGAWRPVPGQEWKMAPIWAGCGGNTLIFEFKSDDPDWPGIDQYVSCPSTPPQEPPQTGWECELPEEICQMLVEVVGSWDPNDKIGNNGYDDEGTLPGEKKHYITSESTTPYYIFFENLDTATAPALIVTIIDTLDDEALDLSTFSLGEISFGETLVEPPPGLIKYDTDIDLRPNMDLIVRIAAELNIFTHTVTWKLTALDPSTMELPDDPLAGFLPPNLFPPEGEGYVLFYLKPSDMLETNDEIQNKATIVFDFNPPIETPLWINTIDDQAPQSYVEPFGPVQSSPQFLVSWTGVDNGSGIKDYSIYYSEDGRDERILWLKNTKEESALFNGQGNGRHYRFYCQARDNVGNNEEAHLVHDAETTVIASLFCDKYYLLEQGSNVLFTLNAGTEHAHREYLLLGSIHGTEPGFPLPGDLTTLPLNWDGATHYILGNLNSRMFLDFYRNLDAMGMGSALTRFELRPQLIGKKLYFAYCLIGEPWDFVSNPVEISLVK